MRSASALREQIRLDEPGTWPLELRHAAELAAQHPACQSSFTADVRPPPDLCNRIMKALSDRGIIVYQCARLLDSEIEDIQAKGIRAASDELLAYKLALAQREGLLKLRADRVRTQSSWGPTLFTGIGEHCHRSVA